MHQTASSAPPHQFFSTKISGLAAGPRLAWGAALTAGGLSWSPPHPSPALPRQLETPDHREQKLKAKEEELTSLSLLSGHRALV